MKLPPSMHASMVWTTLLALTPLLIWRRLVVAMRNVRCQHATGIDPSVLMGAVLGPLLLVQALPQGALGFYAVFGVGGFWDVPFDQSLALVEPLAIEALPRLASEAPVELLISIGVAMMLWLLWLTVALPRPPRRAAALLLAAEAVVCLTSTLGGVWAALLLVWTAGQLNVWLLLVAILLIQDARYAHPPRSRYVIEWIWQVTGRPGPPMRWLNRFLAGWNDLAQRRKLAKSEDGRLPKRPGKAAALRTFLAHGKVFSLVNPSRRA